MCFYHDPDWLASVYEDSRQDSGPAAKCDECRKPIAPDQWRRTVHQEEYEYCNNCYPDCRDETDRGSDGECDHGEEFDYVCCRDCHTLRKAIRQVEKSEGCHGMSAEPSLGGMLEDVADYDGWEHYLTKFRELGLTDAAKLVEELYAKEQEY